MKRFSRYLVSVAATAAFVFLPYAVASAQSNGLSVVPRRDYTLKPGEKVQESLSITNLNKSETLQLKLIKVDFKAQDETGTPSLLKENDQPTAWSLKQYISVPEQVTVGPAKSTTIPISISIPANLGAGSYYSAIEYATVNPNKPDQVTVSASSVTLVFANVPGSAREQMTFKQFGTFVPDKNNNSGTFGNLFIDKKPQVLAYRIKNEGNIAEQPKGSILIKDMWGKEISLIKDANPKDQLALISQTRRFDVCINGVTEKSKDGTGTEIETVVCKDPALKPGRYTAMMSLFYGQNGNENQEITAATSFWYLPWWFIALAVVILGVIAGFVTFIIFKIRGMRMKSRR